MAADIYLTGASGRLGRAVLELIDARPLVRRKSGLEGEIVSDFSTESLRKTLKDADAVIHLAGSRDFLDQRKAWEGNVELTRRIVEATPEKAKVIFSSSISVYGKRMAEVPADENTPLRPDTPYAKTKLEAERIVAAHPKHVILRIGPIYGPAFEEYSKVLRMLERGRMRIIGDGRNRIPFVHVMDVARAIKGSVGNGHGVYVLVGECLSQEEVYSLAAKGLGVSPPSKRTPVTLAKLYSHIELFRSQRLGGKARFIPEDIAVLSSDRAFDCGKAREELGFSPRPLEEGISEMVGDYRKRKKG